MKMDTPARYRLKVQGTLEAEWAENIGGLTVTSVNMVSDTPETTLEGLLQDQAALAGLLIALYELHLPLMSVEYLKEVAA